MKAREWIAYLERQRRAHGKRLFTVTELANAVGASGDGFYVVLSRLRDYGVIQRYARGIYGLPGIDSPEILLPQIDPRAYITGSYGLYLHNLISQVPVQITAFTDRRHGRSRIRRTPAGTFRFVTVSPPVYRPPGQGLVAPAAQALYDYYYISRKEGVDPKTRVSFLGLVRISPGRIEELAPSYPRTVGREIREELKHQAEAP